MLQVPAAAFLPTSSAVNWRAESDGYVVLNPSPTNPGGELMTAAVELPEGVQLLYLGLYFRDADDTDAVTATLRVEQNLVTRSSSDLAAVSSAIDGGYGMAFDSLNHTVRHSEGQHATVSVRLGRTFWATPGGLAFRGVDVWYVRQLSVPTGQSFLDVPPTDNFWPHVEALADSGITIGCATDLFCPTAFVSRRQMAVFLARALGLHFAP